MGRGRGVANLPAWMSAGPSAAAASDTTVSPVTQEKAAFVATPVMGRGRGVANLPAWMSAGPSAAPHDGCMSEPPAPKRARPEGAAPRDAPSKRAVEVVRVLTEARPAANAPAVAASQAVASRASADFLVRFLRLQWAAEGGDKESSSEDETAARLLREVGDDPALRQIPAIAKWL